MQFTSSIHRLRQEIDSAEAIVIGAGAGLSTSAGLTYNGERFATYFGDFEAAYGFHDMYSGGFYPFKTPEERWAYWSRLILCNRYDVSAQDVYFNLLKLVFEKNYFVLTTNVDHQFQLAGFDKERLFYTQGDYGLFQCSVPCSQKTYDNEASVRRMAAEQKNMRIPSELLPFCPDCGKPMTMNLRSDDHFVEDVGWHDAAARYSQFLHSCEGKHVLFLELGVGYNTPGIIKYPFLQMTATNEKAVYACVNFGDADSPQKLKARSICISTDIGDCLVRLIDNSAHR